MKTFSNAINRYGIKSFYLFLVSFNMQWNKEGSFCPDLIPIHHHLCCKDEALHFSLTFRQTQTVVLNFEACALEIGSLLSVRTTRCSHILPPLL